VNATDLVDCKRTVGLKETMRAVEKGSVEQVFIAKDAEPCLLEDLRSACAARAIPVIEVDTMKELGRACKIQVGTAAAAKIRS